jgi:hypothetical protein
MALLFLVGCTDDIATINSGEVITTVILDFGGGVVATANDPDGDGGEAPVIDPITLPAGNHTLAIQFQNRLEDPPEEITEEVLDEGEDHQVFFTGSATMGPLAITYADTDRNGLPIGLANTVTATAGTGMLTVTLRHMPPVNDTAVKTADLAEQVKTTGTAALPGGSDAVVTFPVTVQ